MNNAPSRLSALAGESYERFSLCGVRLRRIGERSVGAEASKAGDQAGEGSIYFMKTEIIITSFVIALAFPGCKPAGGSKPAGAPPAPVEIALVEKRAMPVEVKSIGAVEPLASVQVKSKVQGEILKVHFPDGTQVKAGDLLFSIDPRSFDAALDRAQANLAIAKVASDNATEQADRYTALIAGGAASKEQASQFLTTAQSQKSELAARQADVNAAKLSLEWTQLVSPISGRTGAALLKAGNIAQPNVDTLVVINQMQPIYVTFSLPENSLTSVRRWMSEGTLAVTALDPDRGKTLGMGELAFVDNTVDRASGMITFKATFPNADESLWPGQFVDLSVKLSEEPDAIVVPAAAVMEGQQGAQVFVVDGEVANLRKVSIERTTDGISVVKEGLKPGEKVVVTGQLRVTPGGKVMVKEAAQTKAPVVAP